MKAWFYSKEPHERQVILALAVLIGLSLIYLLIWAPISDSYQQNSTKVKAQRELLGWMQKNSAEIIRLQGAGKKAARVSGPLLSTIDRTIKSGGLGPAMKRLEPKGSNRVQIWFELAGFDALISWLSDVATRYDINIESINIERQDQAGKVNARLILIKGGGK